jgi:hypothetical protein
LVPGINPADIRVSENGATAQIGKDTAQKTVAQLELVPSLQADNKDLQQEVKNGQDMLVSSEKALESQTKLTEAQQTVISTQDKLTSLLQTEIGKADAVCEAKVNVEKTNTKKAYMKGFKWGLITGFIGGIFTGHTF